MASRKLKGMKTVRVEEAQMRLPELVESAASGEEIVITKGETPVAKLVSSAPRHSVLDHRPGGIRGVLRPLASEDDLLDEMLSA
jgi:prevent-host-death family protein